MRLELFAPDDHLPQISEQELGDVAVLEEIFLLKAQLKNEVMILGHHYQHDDIIQFADFVGDSLALAKIAQKNPRPFIIFCGVHFMAETANMLTYNMSQVILPDPNAGCSMADMARNFDVEQAWKWIHQSTSKSVVPITYINCSAELKAFVGRNGGSICTSSNAKKIISWALEKGDKLFFFPDQHLGRNTCYDLGIALDEMVVYNPHLPQGGLSREQIERAKVILWYGYCSVHKGFTLEHIHHFREHSPQTTIIVHPECSFEVVNNADLNGSTNFIVDTIAKAAPGAEFAVGTEVNLVNRLAKDFPDKKISSLSPYQCLCTTMYRIRPRWLLSSLRSIAQGKAENVVTVTEKIKNESLLALDQMLKLS